MTLSRTDRPTPHRDILPAALCWAGSMGVLLLVTLTDTADPGLVSVPTVRDAVWWVVAVALTVQCAALLRARTAPVAVLLLVAGVQVLVAAAGAGEASSITSLPLVVACYLAFVDRTPADVRGVGLAAAGLTVVAYLVAGLRAGDTTWWMLVAYAVGQALVLVGAPAFVALLVTTRRDVGRAREQEILALAREHDALVREARAQERTAMARELHDIAAHHLSGIAVMAAAVERQIITDPDAAREGVRQVRGQSTAVLRDLRRLVGLLREGDAELSVESLTGIAALVEQASAAGATVELLTLPAADDDTLGAGLGPLAQLTAYRMVQEALANAVQHAPGAPSLVTVDDTDPATVVVTVRNDAAATADPGGTGGGFGLVGMRERAELTAADLRYGPTIDGGWEVSLRLRRDPTEDQSDAGAPSDDARATRETA
ncbi:sensor histidine kinase [Sanguibacter suaedae]|uniref:histidine kinase n=1 Tax=Sanguibacter suaedae TaxID=2795737 RepID=A0A934I9M8_9MICO|nr:histidine kinase [Sanguibacter suaedae]MBI9115622.1 hypothetical protein [Sanguibacter suaedae]